MNFHTLMFGWEYPPLHLGGLGVACQGLVRGLMHHGVKVSLVLPHAETESEGDLDVISPTDKSIQNIRIPSMLGPYDSFETYAAKIKNIPRELNHMYGHDLGDAVYQYTEMAVDLTKEINPDVIHAHDWMTYGAAARVSRSKQKPLVAHIHATELDRTNFQPHQWIYDQERIGFEASDKIIAVSQYTKNILIEHYGVPADKIAVVHNGNTDIHAETREILSDTHGKKDPMVLFLGRLTVQKGPWQFLEMAARVHAHRPDVRFVIAGDGNMLGELINRACEMGLQDSVIFAGKVDNAEAKQLYLQASCFVMPSVSEPFGLVALEAITHGAPVIMSKQSGVGEVIPHSFKVDFWDSDMMADCVLTVLREEPLAEQLRSEAPHILQSLTWHNQAEKVCSIYQSLIS